MSNETILQDKRTNIEWTPYLATAYAEGFCEGEGASNEEILEAYAYLIKSGTIAGLQGSFGRAAKSLIDRDLITVLGEVNWDAVEELINN